MSNRRKARPARDPVVGEIAAASACPACGSGRSLTRWRDGGWEITPLHKPGCTAQPAGRHQIGEDAVAAVTSRDRPLAYIAESDGKGGVVIGSPAGLS